MKHIYPSFPKKSLTLALAGALLFGGHLQAQTSACGPIVENFNNTGGTMAGFSSSTVNSTAAGFTYSMNGQNGVLQRCNITSGGTVFELVTPTYRTTNTQTSVGYGFELSGAVTVGRVIVLLQYIDNSNNVNTVEAANFVPIYNGAGGSGVATECRAIAINSFVGFTPGDSYRFIFQFTASSSSNNNQCIVFDNFRTNGLNALAPLPVSFTGLNYRRSGNGVELIWNVAGEQDVLRYEVERSTNGRDFTKIGEVTATRNAAYSFTDAAAVAGPNFYRVRNIDADGRFKYSPVVRANLSRTIVLNAYPQPARNEIRIEHGAVTARGTLTLAGASGQVVRTVQLRPDVTQTQLKLDGLNPGMYILRFDNGEGNVESLKIVKQ
jgi:hypothetical protein